MRIVAVIFLLFIQLSLRAQDLIVLYPNDSLNVKISSVDDEKVHFIADIGTQDEDAYTLDKKDIRSYIINYYRPKLAEYYRPAAKQIEQEFHFDTDEDVNPSYSIPEEKRKLFGANFIFAKGYRPYVEDTYYNTYIAKELMDGTVIGLGADIFVSKKIGFGVEVTNYFSRSKDPKARVRITYVAPTFIFNTYWREKQYGFGLRASIGYYDFELEAPQILYSELRGNTIGVKIDPSFQVLLFPSIYLKFGTPFYFGYVDYITVGNGNQYLGDDEGDVSRVDLEVGIHVKF